MFCPNCKTEYREGFGQCSDCGATLVESLDGSAPSPDDVPELFWSGNSPRFYQEFRAALKAANIPFMDEPPPRFLYSSLRPPLEIWTSKLDHEAAAKVRYQITGESDEPASEATSRELAGEDYQRRTEPSWMRVWTTKAARGEPVPKANPDPDESVEGATTSEEGSNLLKTYFASDAPDDVFSGEFFPEDATAQVFAGDLDVAENLKTCLREVGIPSAIDQQEDSAASSAKVRVLPEHEARAKEIIREVIEATPPE
jgi:hypothetical protein